MLVLPKALAWVAAMIMSVGAVEDAGATVTAATHRRAVTANTQGWRYFNAGQLPRAEMRFRDALELDPDYVLAHYNLACVSSRLRDAAVALDQLRWLQASSDPLAKAKLDKGASDPDLDFVSALPAARGLLQLPPLTKDAAPSIDKAPLVWLSERHGVWSAEQPTSDCAERSYRFAFAADGTLQLTVREACAGETVRTRVFDGRFTSGGEGGGREAKRDLRVAVPSWAQWPATVRLEFVACPGLEDAPSSCFTLASDTSQLGPFHRGLPGASPMRVRRDVAAAHPQPSVANE
ncbi:MAG TPA: hypothetical protein VIA18_26635 [Polyangia bacterium]|nr:hypothetical protein [Polyangia bacterium]